MKNKSIKYTLLTAAVILGLGFGQPLWAQLQEVGPVSVQTGFPAWYEDANGLRVQLCDEFDPNLPADEQPPCLPELNDFGLGVVQGNIGEALYYAAVAEFTLPTGEFILAQCVLEAAGPELPGDVDSVSNAALIRLRNLTVAGSYTIVTPCGTFGPISFDPAAGSEIRDEIAAIGLSPNFSGALNGPVQLFASNGTGAAGFLGDAITPGPLTGPLRTGGVMTVTVSGAITATHDQFSVVGKVSGCDDLNLPPVAVDDLESTTVAEPVIIDVLANDTDDVGLNPAAVVIVSPPAAGTAVPNPNGTVTFTPSAGFTGTVTFTYTVQDFCALTSNPATVTVFVEDLQVDSADFRTRIGKWNVSGTSTFDALTLQPEAGTITYLTPLVGAQEVPPVDTAAEGGAGVSFNDATPDAFDFFLTVDGLPVSTITMAHIHLGETGTNGGVLFHLCGTDTTAACTPVDGVLAVEGTLTATDLILVGDVNTFAEAVSAIQEGRTYVNVHSEAFPAGEIRGQIGRNVIVLRAGETGPVIGTAEVQADAGSAKPWRFTGKSRVSPGDAFTGVDATSALGNTVTRDLHVR